MWEILCNYSTSIIVVSIIGSTEVSTTASTIMSTEAKYYTEYYGQYYSVYVSQYYSEYCRKYYSEYFSQYYSKYCSKYCSEYVPKIIVSTNQVEGMMSPERVLLRTVCSSSRVNKAHIAVIWYVANLGRRQIIQQYFLI